MKVLVELCDIWKSNSVVYGVYTNRKQLEKDIRKLIKNGDIVITHGCPIDLPLSNFTIKDINNYFDYILLREIDFNKEV